jgi:hypothetical protein
MIVTYDCQNTFIVRAGNTKRGKYHSTTDLQFDWFGISCLTTDNICFYLQNRLIQTSQTGGQWYNDTSPFSIPWCGPRVFVTFTNLAGAQNRNIFFLQLHFLILTSQPKEKNGATTLSIMTFNVTTLSTT